VPVAFSPNVPAIPLACRALTKAASASGFKTNHFSKCFRTSSGRHSGRPHFWVDSLPIVRQDLINWGARFANPEDLAVWSPRSSGLCT
jgi:hypothetical protein